MSDFAHKTKTVRRLVLQFGYEMSRLMALVAAGVLLTGCASVLRPVKVAGSDFQPDNVYIASTTLPQNLKRVAVLPLMTDERSSALVDGREALDPILTSELLKTRKFELLRITPERSRTCTGRVGWTGEELLPENFFSSLQEASGCDAVLFCQLTAFRAYAPLAIGWRMKLVDARSGQILWAGDEMFDAGQSSVQNSARRYQLSQIRSSGSDASEWVMGNSPRTFGQYTVASLLRTLPAR